MSSDLDDRYQEIMRRMAQRRAEQEAAPKRQAKETMAHVLDSLDAYGKLERIKNSRVLHFAYGPKAFEALKPMPWVGVMLWRRGSGYHGYKTLQIIGVWAYDQSGTPIITVGTKRLAYNAPTYEAEAYQKLIKRGFDLYYEGDASPPPVANRVYTAQYHFDRRLELRDELRTVLNDLVTHV
jgi:hypothetical protein